MTRQSQVRRILWIAILFVSCLCAPAQGQRHVLQQAISSFDVEGISRIDAILLLAKKEDIPLGIEYAGPKLFEPVTIDVGPTNVGTIVKMLFPSGLGFRISDQDVLVISHRDVPGGRINILNTRLSHFSIPRCSLQRAYVILEVLLFKQLTPPSQWQGVMGSISGESSAQIGPFELTNVTVREALNRIVREHGRAAWIVQVRPEMLVRPSGVELEDKILDGSLIVWTIVEYDNSAMMSSIGRITQEHVLTATSAQSH